MLGKKVLCFCLDLEGFQANAPAHILQPISEAQSAQFTDSF